MRVVRLIGVAMVAAVVSFPAVAQQVPSQYVFRLTPPETAIMLKGVRKLTIEEGSDLMNRLVAQVREEEQEASKPPVGAEPPAAEKH